jgi:hypothetical protein
MPNTMNWQTLEYRNSQFAFIYFFKMRNMLACIDHNQLTPTRNLNYLIPQSLSFPELYVSGMHLVTERGKLL